MIKQYVKGLSGKQKFRYLIIMVYFILNLILLLIAFQMNLDDLQRLVKIARYIPYMRYVALANIVLFTVILIMFYVELRNAHAKQKKAEDEVVKIKSKLFDQTDQKGDEIGKKKEE